MRIINLISKYMSTKKTLNNTSAKRAKKNVSDIVFWGDGDTFQLISKASSKKEGWMKSTKAMEIHGVGCVIQITTQNKANVSEAAVFVAGVKIQTLLSGGETVGRKIVRSQAPDSVQV